MGRNYSFLELVIKTKLTWIFTYKYAYNSYKTWIRTGQKTNSNTNYHYSLFFLQNEGRLLFNCSKGTLRDSTIKTKSKVTFYHILSLVVWTNKMGTPLPL